MSLDHLFHETEKGAPLVLPLRAFYAGEPAREVRRRQFYRLMAAEFDWPGWKKAPAAAPRLPKAGRDGRPRDLVKGTRKNPGDLDQRVSPAEFLQTSRLLNDPTTILADDKLKRSAEGYGDIRRSIARLIVDAHEATTSGDLKSPDWKRQGGGGSARSTSPAEGRLIAAESMNVMRAAMPNEEALMIERVFVRDEFAWEVDSTEARKILLEDLRLALDFAGFAWGQISRERMEARWPRFKKLHALAAQRARKLRETARPRA